MKHNLKKYTLTILAYLAVLYPLWVSAGGMGWSFSSGVIMNFFPLFGIAAFTIMWLHVVSEPFQAWLGQYFDREKFVDRTSYLVLVCIIMHPLLVLISIKFNVMMLLQGGIYIWLAILGFFLLIIFDIGKFLQKKEFFFRHWNKILFLSTIGFLLIFFHSLGIGSNLQSGFLRKLWIFYGVTGIIATIYTYGIKRFLSK